MAGRMSQTARKKTAAEIYWEREQRLERKRAEGHDLQEAVLIAPPPAVVHQSPQAPRERNDGGRFLFDLTLPIERVTWAHLDNGVWHRWLRQRISEHFGITIQGAEGHLRAWSNANDALLIRSGNVVGCVVVQGNPVDSKRHLREVFVFVSERDEGWQKSAVRLYRQFQLWAKSLNISDIRVGIASDLSSSKLVQLTGAVEEATWWLDAPKQ